MGKLKLARATLAIGLFCAMSFAVAADVQFCGGTRSTSPILMPREEGPPKSIYCAAKRAVMLEVRPYLGGRIRVRFDDQQLSATTDNRPLIEQQIIVDVGRDDLALVMARRLQRTKKSLGEFALKFEADLCMMPDFRRFTSANGVAEYYVSFHFPGLLGANNFYRDAAFVRIESCATERTRLIPLITDRPPTKFDWRNLPYDPFSKFNF